MYRRIPTWNLGTRPFRMNPLWEHAIQIAVWGFSDVFVIGAVFVWGKRSLKRILSLQRFSKREPFMKLPWFMLSSWFVLQLAVGLGLIPWRSCPARLVCPKCRWVWGQEGPVKETCYLALEGEWHSPSIGKQEILQTFTLTPADAF